MRILDNLARGLERFERALLLVGSVCLFAMMIVTTLDVTLRYFFHAPVPGAMYYAMYLQAVIACFGFAYVQAKTGHIKVEFISSRIPARYRAILTIIGYLAMLVIAGLITWAGWYNAMDSWHIREVDLAGGLDIPIYAAKLVVPIGAGVLCLQLLLDIVQWAFKLKIHMSDDNQNVKDKG